MPICEKQFRGGTWGWATTTVKNQAAPFPTNTSRTDYTGRKFPCISAATVTKNVEFPQLRWRSPRLFILAALSSHSDENHEHHSSDQELWVTAELLCCFHPRQHQATITQGGRRCLEIYFKPSFCSFVELGGGMGGAWGWRQGANWDQIFIWLKQLRWDGF